MMNTFRFAEPQWLHLVWLVLLMAFVMVAAGFRRHARLEQFISRRMQTRLVRARSRSREIISGVLTLSALLCFIVARMRPQWGLELRNVTRVGAQIMICLDVSKSMLAEDAMPNRLERAKAEVLDLLDRLQGDQVGLIAFAGTAAVLSPMTTDFGFLKQSLKYAGPHVIGRGGTRLEAPIRKALVGMQGQPEMTRVILLITDGEDLDSRPLDAAELAREQGIPIICIGFGDEAGSRIQITNPQTGAREYIRDLDGQPVLSRLNGDLLREIALKTHGAYIPAGTGALDLDSIFQAHIAPLARRAYQSTVREVRQEVYQPCVAVGLILLLMGWSVAHPASYESPRSLRRDRRARTPRIQSRTGVHRRVSIPSATRVLCGMAFTISVAIGSATMAMAVERDLAATGSVTRPDAIQTDGAVEAGSAKVTAEETDGDAPRSLSVPPDWRTAWPPRRQYNHGLTLIESDPTHATELLEHARSEAGADIDLRFNATYNLGWLAAKQAEQKIQQAPTQALELLRSAVHWFREALQLRPKDRETRVNYELVARRLAQLEDAQRNAQESSLEERLDQIIASQRTLLEQIASRIEEGATEAPSAATQSRWQQISRDLATQQRIIVDRVNHLLRGVHDELQRLRQAPGISASPQPSARPEWRQQQLQAVLGYLQTAEQRLGQARQQIRWQLLSRAFRRASLGLNELKQGRDQLRGVPDRIRVLHGDLEYVHLLTQWLLSRPAADTPATSASRPVPLWLSLGLVRDMQRGMTQRIEPFSRQLRAAVQAESSAQSPDDADPATRSPDEDRQRELLSAAGDHLVQAVEALQQADLALRERNLQQVPGHQQEALRQLEAAMELFLDARGLIELIYRSESLLGAPLAVLAPDVVAAGSPASTGEQTPSQGGEPLGTPKLAQEFLQRNQAIQAANLPRSQRLAKQIKHELEKVTPQKVYGPSLPPPTKHSVQEDAAGSEQDEAQRLRERLLRAEELTAEVQREIAALLDQPRQYDEQRTDFRQLARQWKELMQDLQTLRELFFTVIDRLQQAAQEQQQLNDETLEHLAQRANSGDARSGDATEDDPQLGPLASRQAALHQRARTIDQELRDLAGKVQSLTDGPEVAEPAQPPEQAQAKAEQLRQAADAVSSAAERMDSARRQLEKTAPQIRELAPIQRQALSELLRALELLRSIQSDATQPEQTDQPQSDRESSGAEPRSGGDASLTESSGSPEELSTESETEDLGKPEVRRMLQLLRDRDAQRQADRARRARVHDPVDRDW